MQSTIYFELIVTNNKFDGELRALSLNCKLESTKGETFSAVPPLDELYAELHKGRSARGGVVFFVYPESEPSVLRYQTGLKDSTGEPLEAVLLNLHMPER